MDLFILFYFEFETGGVRFQYGLGSREVWILASVTHSTSRNILQYIRIKLYSLNEFIDCNEAGQV